MKCDKAIVYCSDSDGYPMLERSAWSVRKFIGDDVRIHVVSDSYVSPCVFGSTVSSPTDALREVGFFPDGWNRCYRFSTLFRLAIPLMREFDSYDSVVYLDTDTLVVSEDARGLLFETEFTDADVIAAPDREVVANRNAELISGDLDLRAREMFGSLIEKNGVQSKAYCNAGVLVLNLKKIRKDIESYKARLVEFWRLELQGKFQLLDQDFINVFMDVSPTLDRRLNCLERSVCQDEAIRHYIGDRKSEQTADASSLGYSTLSQACRTQTVQSTAVGKRHLILFVSHIVNDETVWRYRKLANDTSELGYDIVWCVDTSSTDRKPPEDVRVWSFDFTDRKYFDYAFKGMKYHSIASSIFMSQAERLSEYDYVWYVEYDVCYSGDWSTFFRRMESYGHDLVCLRLHSYDSSKDWYWWLQSVLDGYPLHRAYKCLNCISRLSSEFILKVKDFVCRKENAGRIFYENCWPSIAVSTGSCLDIYDGYCDRDFNYTVTPRKRLEHVDKDRLYHAVKPDVSWDDVMKGRYVEKPHVERRGIASWSYHCRSSFRGRSY